MTQKQIESKIAKKYEEVHQLQDKLDNLLNKKELPGLKKKYEGKYFKYDNGYSAEERWLVYSYCSKVISRHEALCEKFEQNTQGEWRFETNAHEGFWLFKEEITEEEYDKASLQLISAASYIRQLK